MPARFPAIAVLLFLAFALSVPGASAGTLSVPLEDRLGHLAPDDEIVVLVVLRDRVDIRSLARGMHAAKMTNRAQHLRTVTALKTRAAATQGDLLEELEELRRTGRVRAHRAYWLVNAVRVATTADVVRSLAHRPDVEIVESDLQVRPVGFASGPEFLTAETGLGAAPGVVAIGARRVWHELGIDGSGALVGNLDTGVDSQHIALAGNWRGHAAPAAECWLDLSDAGVSFPHDPAGHGTHVMGTMVGVAPGDTVGVAPGAMWISANPNNSGFDDEFDADVLAALQFMTDPDGDPATTDDVPDAVQNSWGVADFYPGYDGCDSRWWEAIDACEAAGVVLTFSAGNEGPGPGTLLSPADRATDLYNAFSVGSVGADDAVSDFSSRGPSACGGLYGTKPEIVAPGEDVRSCWPGNIYVETGGTSMAGPHVAGVVALMRAADPDLDVITIKEILLATARDLGPPGEDDDSGFGCVDAFAAVQRVLGGYGLVRGTVTDATGETPLPGARVHVFGDGDVQHRLTGPDGGFLLSVRAGDSLLGVELFGYDAATWPLSVPASGSVVLDPALDPLPYVSVSGRVTTTDGAPLAEARVHMLGTPLPPVPGGPDGGYAVELPVGTPCTLEARAPGYFRDHAEIRPEAPATVDFSLSELTDEGFETGDLSGYPWRTGGDEPWRIDGETAYEGGFSARSGDVIGNQASELSVELTVDAGDVVFWYRLRSEHGDRLIFRVDGEERGAWSGLADWTRAAFSLAAGDHVLSWTYEKDAFIDAYEDAVWIDMVGKPRAPAVQWTPTAVTTSVTEGESLEVPITLTNTGAVDLRYTVAVDLEPDRPVVAKAAAPRPASKDAPDLRRGLPPLASSGGPDAFGYVWEDSDGPDGPPYVWEDISGPGEAQPFLDDSVLTLALPFAFPFYGREFEDVTVCSNGWLTFSTPYIHFLNLQIPDPLVPNSMICPYWEDLDPEAQGAIYTLADAEQDRFTVQWDGVVHWNTRRAQTFQVQLHADGRILCYYRTVSMQEQCTVGIENHEGSDGLQVVFAAPYLHDGLALRFRPTVPWLAMVPQAGSVAPGSSAEVLMRLDTRDTAPGQYQGLAVLATNDPLHPRIELPVTLTVSEDVANEDGPPPSAATTLTFHPATPNPFNPTTLLTFELPRPGRCLLTIHDLHGRRVRHLVAAALTAGRHEFVWDGRGDDGRVLASGRYQARLGFEDSVLSRPLSLLK